MQIDLAPLKNKQRIYIGGNRGVDQIFDIVKHVVTHIGKSVDFYSLDLAPTLTEAPVVIMKNGDELLDGQALFNGLNLHILLLHRIKEPVPEEYGSIDKYVAQYEKLADNLPKAGTFIFNIDDDVATLIGKKEREDIKNIEYSALPAQKMENGISISLKTGSVLVPTQRDKFRKRVAGARALLNRIGVSDSQILDALKSFS